MVYLRFADQDLDVEGSLGGFQLLNLMPEASCKHRKVFSVGVDTEPVLPHLDASTSGHPRPDMYKTAHESMLMDSSSEKALSFTLIKPGLPSVECFRCLRRSAAEFANGITLVHSQCLFLGRPLSLPRSVPGLHGRGLDAPLNQQPRRLPKDLVRQETLSTSMFGSTTRLGHDGQASVSVIV